MGKLSAFAGLPVPARAHMLEAAAHRLWEIACWNVMPTLSPSALNTDHGQSNVQYRLAGFCICMSSARTA